MKFRKVFKTKYLMIQLLIRKVEKSILIHRLVYAVFKNRGELLPTSIEVNHIDSDPTNNRIDNLQAISKKENLKHSTLSQCWFREYCSRPIRKHREERKLKRIRNQIPKVLQKEMYCLNCKESTFEDGTLSICCKCLHILKIFPKNRI